MSYAVMPLNEWQKIVNSVRAKTGNTEPLLSTQLAAEIDSITVGSTDFSSFAQHIQGTKTEVTAEELAGVTTIRNYAFCYASITSIELPETIAEIGSNAFSNASNLKRVDYNGDLASWCNIKMSGDTSSPTANGADLYIKGVL